MQSRASHFIFSVPVPCTGLLLFYNAPGFFCFTHFCFSLIYATIELLSDIHMEVHKMPKWFARLFAVLMVIACGLTAWYAYQHEKLTFAIEDVRVSLETSQARERKQQYEYDEVTKALPEAQKELEEIQPKADAAKAEESTLRDQRKALRSSNTDLNEQVTAADARVSEQSAAFQMAVASLSDLTETLEDGMADALSVLSQSLAPSEADE